MSEENSGENSISDIRRFFEEDADPPLKQGEFVEFWKSLTEEEKHEFRITPLK